jgi:hypothetical protein
MQGTHRLPAVQHDLVHGLGRARRRGHAVAALNLGQHLRVGHALGSGHAQPIENNNKYKYKYKSYHFLKIIKITKKSKGEGEEQRESSTR